MNDRYDNLYVPVVKLIRQTRRAHLGKRPGGLFFEILAYHAFNAGLSGDNLPNLYVNGLRAVAEQLAVVVGGADVVDPTMPGATISVRVTELQMKTAASRFAELAAQAEDALAEDERCRAAAAFRACLGKGGDEEWVFPMPVDCNEDGSAKAGSVIVAGDRHVPAGDRRFA